MIRLLSGDCRDVLPTLAAESVHTVVTSPPYYGLRDYGTALWNGGDAGCDHGAARRGLRNAVDRGGVNPGIRGTERDPLLRQCACGAVRVDRQIGLEATPDEYLATMVAVFREVRRVLRRDGTCWVNMGDSYAGSPAGNFGTNRPEAGVFNTYRSNTAVNTTKHAKPKDLLLMPARLALALQADGWWVRSDIIWHKPNPMPESCKDRPTSAHEHVFLLTRSSRYFYDAAAVAEPADSFGRQHTTGIQPPKVRALQDDGTHGRGGDLSVNYERATRACRNVWTIATSPFSAAHFATFPPELAERCIRAGTSERGCCAACGKPWLRQMQVSGGILGKSWHPHEADAVKGNAPRLGIHNAERDGLVPPYQRTTTGWAPGCQCGAGVAPCTVLDPFIGAGTTALVADRLQRDCIGIDLNTQYTRMAMNRCIADAPLFTSFPPAEPPEDMRMADLFTDMAAD